MKTLRLLYTLPILLLLLGCNKEAEVSLEHTYHTIHYSATAQGGTVTRAGLDAGHYIFEAGDRLFVSHIEAGNVVLYGFLTLISGAGERVGYFEGDLVCDDEFDLLPGTTISVTLVGDSDAIHSISGGKITSTSYPNNEYATSLHDAVRKYGNFTCNTTYDATSFTLNQSSAFLVFEIRVHSLDAPVNTTVTAQLRNGSSDPFWSASITITSAGKAQFVAAFPGGEQSLDHSKLSLSWTTPSDSNELLEIDDIADQTLAANNYYTVSRSAIPFDGFRIKATVASTSVTFHNNYKNYLYCSTDGGTTWAVPTSAITLANVGDEIWVLGRKDNYKNAKAENNDYGSPNGNPLFSTESSKLVTISGEIMSLLCRPDEEDYSNPENWTFGTTLPEDAFNGTFSKGKNVDLTYINIDPSHPLILPNYTAVRCYKGMFRKCTSLTNAPDLPATTMSAGCYNSMLRDCSSLAYVRCYFSAHNEGDYVIANYDRTSLESWLDKWTDGISTNGTLYCHPDMIAYFTNAMNKPNDAGYTGWYAEYTKASMPANWTATEWTPAP